MYTRKIEETMISVEEKKICATFCVSYIRVIACSVNARGDFFD